MNRRFLNRFLDRGQAARLRRSWQRLMLLLGCALLCGDAPVFAAEYWWNQNGTAAGWGTGGTWNTTNAFFSTTNSATASAAAATTTTADTLNIGTSTVAYSGTGVPGEIVVSGTQFIGNIIAGSANTVSTVIQGTNTWSFAASGTITNNSAQEFVVVPVVAGAATRLDLNAVGGGITMASSTTTYTGITYVNVGTVTVNNAGSLGASGSDANRTVVASGARIVFNNTPRTYTERFEIAGAGVGGSTGALVNTGARTTNLNGQISLSGNATIYSDSGSLTIGSAASTGGIVLGGNTLTFLVAGGTQTVATTAISGSGSVVKSGASLLNLNVASTYSGGTLLNAGTISVGNATALGSTSGQLTVNGGVLNLNNNSVTVGNLTGTSGTIRGGAAGSRTFTVGQGDFGGGTFQGVIADGTGTTALTKTGTGVITLAGNNTYSGATAINAGVLLINGSTSASSAVTVGLNGTLGGNGTIGGATTVNGLLSPGSSPGVLTFNGALSLAGATTLEIDGTSTRGIDFDGVNTAGLLTYGGSLTLDFGTTLSGTQTFDLFNIGAGGQTGNFTAVSLSGSYTGSLTRTGSVWETTDGSGNTWSFSQTSGDVTFIAVPEPTTLALLAVGAGGVGLGAARRFRRRRTAGRP